MYSHFTCPRCRTRNFVAGEPPAGNSYFHGLKCRSCKLSGIIWVGSKDTSELLLKQVAGARAETIAIGGGKATLQDAVPGVAIGTAKDVADLVTERVSAKLVDEYSQGARLKDYTPGEADIQQGVCEGQCLHWIRRVLQDGRIVYDARKGKDGKERPQQAIRAKQSQQHLGGVAAQRTVRPEASQEIASRNNAQLLNRLNQLIQSRGIETARAQQMYEEFVSQGFYRYNWSSVASLLDQKLEAEGIARKRSFSGIVCILSKDREERTDGPAGFAKSFAQVQDLTPGTAAVLSIGLRAGVGEAGGSISGHAIAVFCARVDRFFVFDPNIGVFGCTSRENLAKLLFVLIGGGWTKIFGWELNGEYGFSLFTRRETPQDLRIGDRTVAMVPSESGTYHLNRTNLPQ